MAVLAPERVERPPSLFGGEAGGRAPIVARDARRDRAGGLGGGLTLDDAIVGAWEGLAARTAVACPLCGGVLRPSSAGTTGDVAGGRCADCGTTLG